MINRTTQLAFFALVGAGLLAACSKDKLTCGSGTTDLDGECVASNPGVGEGGMGGSITEPPGDPPPPDEPPTDEVDPYADFPASRRADAALAASEFSGAIAAGSASRTSALVTWEPSGVFDVTYNVYVSTSDDNFSFGTPQFETTAGVDSWLLTGLERGETHYIVVRAVLEGIEIPGEDVIVSVDLVADDEEPSFVGADRVRTVDGGSVRITWDAASDDISPDEVLTYFVFMGESADEIDEVSAYYISRPGATSVTFKMPQADTEYFFIVRARDAAGNFDDNPVVASGVSGSDTEAPFFSGCDSADSRNASTVDLRWTPATDDIVSEEQIVYNLYASTEPDGHNFSQPSATVVGGDTGAVSDLEAGEKYYFVCRAADPSGNEERNLRLQQAETSNDDTPPIFSGIAAVANLSSTSFELTWLQADDDQSPAEQITYSVYLSETEDGHDFSPGAETASTQGGMGILLEGVQSQTTYYAIVLAEDGAGNRSEAGPATTITTQVSLKLDIERPIFEAKCATPTCHTGLGAPANLVLNEGFSFSNLVGRDPQSEAGIMSGFKLVEPGDPTSSHIMQRLESDTIGFQMPADPMVSFSEAEIDTIRRWIAEGANNN